MADDTPTAPAPVDAEALQRAIAMLQPPSATMQAPQTDSPGAHGFAGFIGDVGNVLAGGPSGLLGLGPDADASAGRKALLNFGINMLMNSGPSYAPRGFGQILASGLQGAQASRAGSEETAYHALGSQQALAQQAFQNRLAAIKEALPLLTLQQRASLGNPFAQGGGTGSPGTSITAANEGGATIGQRQNNPGNLTFAGQPYASPGQGNRFASFPDMATGVAANADQLALYQTQHGVNTVRDAVTRWVGDPKADLTSYIGDVAKAIGVGPDDKIDLTDPVVQQKFIQAQFPHESAGGGYKLDPAVVQKGVQMAAARRGKQVQDSPSQVATATPPTTPPPAAPAAAAPPGRVQVATATPQTQTDATPAPAAPPAYAAAPTREAATVLAAATRQPVMVQGAGGGTVMPDGSFRSAPPLAATAPPAAVPGQPRDITALKDEELSLPEFQQRYRTPLAPDAGAVKVNPQVQADRQAAIGAAQQAVTQAQQGMRAAEQDWTVQRDDKSLQARSAAQQRLETAQQNLQTAQQNANKLAQDAETETVKNRQAAQQAQDQQLAAAYKDARDRANQAADAEKNRQAQIALETQKGDEARKTAAAASENSFVLDTRKKLNDERSAAQETVDSLGLLDHLSKAAGAATPLDSLNWGGMPLRQWLLQKGIGSEDQIAHWGAQQAYEAAINQTVIGLRKGVSMGQLSDRDLSFLQGMSPSVLQRTETREAITAYLRSAQLRKIRFADSVDELWDGGKGMSYGQALVAARKQLPDIVPQIPAGASNADKRDWFTKNVPPGTLYRNSQGDLTVWPGMPGSQ